MDWKELGNNILNKMKTTRILGIIGLVLIYFGLMIPFVGIEFWGSDSVSAYMEVYDNGKGVMLLWLLTIAIMYSDIIAANWPRGKKIFSYLKNQKLVVVPCIIAFIILIATTACIYSDFDDYDVSLYPGYFLSWLGLIATTAYAILYKGNDSTKADDEE